MDFIIGLFIAFIIIYYTFKKELTAPAVLFSLSFFFSGIIFSLNSFVWGYELEKETEIVILLGVFVFYIGSVVALFLPNRSYKIDTFAFHYKIGAGSIILFSLICILYPLLRIMDIISVTGSLNIFGGLGTYRGYEGSTFFQPLLKIFAPICNSLCIVMIVVIMTNKIEKKIIKWYYYVPIISYFVGCALSSSRIEIIYLFIYFVLAYVISYEVKKNKRVSFKQLKYVALSVILLAFTFFGLGYLTGKSQKQESAVDNLSMYAASSFAAFDYYLDGFKYKSDEFGRETFVGLSSLLSWIGVDEKITDDRNKEFVDLGDMAHSTNVYTCYRPLLHDFNYSGMYIVLFLEGLIFQLFYRKSRRSYCRGNMFWIVFYIYFGAYLMLSSVAERVFSCLLTLTTIMFLVSTNYFLKYIHKRV